MPSCFQMSRFSSWQSKMDGSCTLTSSQRWLALPSSRAESQSRRDIRSNGGRNMAASIVVLRDASVSSSPARSLCARVRAAKSSD